MCNVNEGKTRVIEDNFALQTLNGLKRIQNFLNTVTFKLSLLFFKAMVPFKPQTHKENVT